MAIQLDTNIAISAGTRVVVESVVNVIVSLEAENQRLRATVEHLRQELAEERARVNGLAENA